MSKKTEKKRKNRMKPLFLVGSCLLLSGVIRFVGDVAPALADASLLETETAAGRKTFDSENSDSERLYALLREREIELEKLEEDLVARKEFVEAAEVELRTGLETLEAARAELEKLATATREGLAESDGAVAADIDQLVSVYEAMKPKEAAQLFEAMPPKFAAGFLARMRAEQAADILAGLNPEIGYHISALLASRHVRTDRPGQQLQ